MRRAVAFGLLAILLAALAQAPASADTPIGGEVTAHLTLTAAGSPYLVTGDLVVRGGATLTIEAGTVVRFAPGTGLLVENGALRAVGAPGARILLTSQSDTAGGTPAPGDWGFLRFLGGTGDALTVLDQVDIRYGQGVTLQAASPRFDSVAIESLSGPAMRIDLESFPVGSGNSAAGNQVNAVVVASGEMTARGTWGLRGIPYLLEGRVTVGRAPAVTGITPANVEQDSATPASIAGARLEGSTGVAFQGPGVGAQILLGGTPTSLPILINVDPDAPLGPRTFTVDAAAGLTPSGAIVINIVPGTPVIQGIAPSVIPQGAADTRVTIGGRKFNASSVARLEGTDLATTLDGPGELSALIPAASLAVAGTLSLTVANPDPANPGQFFVSAPFALTVSPPPSVSRITPDRGARGAVVDGSIGGANLLGTSAVAFEGTGVGAAILPGGTETNLPVRLTIDAAAATGPRGFTVTTPAGAALSGTVLFTVTPPVPAIGAITPRTGILGSGAQSLTVDGSRFVPESVVRFNGSDRPTTFVHSARLVAALQASDLSALGTFPIQVVNPDAAHPELAQVSNSAGFDVVQPFLTLSPSPLGVPALQSRTLTVTLSIAAPPGGVNVTLAPFAPLVATVNGGTNAVLLVPEGGTEGTVSVEGAALNGGSTTITATAGGFLSANVTVNVSAAPRIHVTPASLLVGAGRSAVATVGSSIPAPPGGLLVTLVQSPAGILDAPATVVIPEGIASVPVTIGGAAVGLANLRGTAVGFATGSSCDVTVRAVAIVLPGSILVSPSLSRPVTVSLTDPAPAGGTTVQFSSSNAAAADPPAPLVIAAGTQSGTVTITGKAAGSATITASDPSGFFQNGTMTVNVQPINITVAPASGSTFVGPAFGARTTVFINAMAPEGGQVINLASSHPAVATVAASVTIPQGQTTAPVDILGIGPGTAVITPSAPGLNTTGTYSVTVVETRFNISRNFGSYGLRTLTGVRIGSFAVSLPAAAPTPVSLTLSVDDPSVALVAPYNTTSAPAASQAFTIPAGTTSVSFDLIGVGARDFTDLGTPLGLALHPATGDLFIAETGNDRVRRIASSTGTISTYAGTTNGFDGDGGPAGAAMLNDPLALSFDAAGNLFVADQANHRIRRVDASTGAITTVAGNSAYSCSQPRDGQSATDAGLCNPRGLDFDAQGRLYIGDQSFHRVRRIDPGSDGLITGESDETIETVAGDGNCGFSGDGAAATSARLCDPHAVRIRPQDQALFVADHSNHRVRRVDADSGVIGTVAGNSSFSCSDPRDGQAATAAGLCYPAGLAFDASGGLYVSERGWHRIRRILPGADGATHGGTDEIIATVAGTGGCGFNGNGRAASGAQVCTPDGILVAPDGRVLFADSSNHQVRAIDPATGLISTVAGSGEAGLKGDGGSAVGPRIHVTAAGFTANDAPIRVDASSLAFSGLGTFFNTLSAPDSFTVRIGSPELGFGYRVAQALTIDLSSSNPGAASVTSSVTIANNVTDSTTATLAVTGAGRTTIGAQVAAATPPLGPIAGTSAEVTVVPATLGVNSDPLSPNSNNRMTTGTGMRNGQYRVTISGPAPAGGVTAHLVSSDPAKVLLAPYNTTTAGAASLDVTIAAGSRSSAGFDVIGVGPAFEAVLLYNPTGLAADPASGALYIADQSNHRIRRVDAATGALTSVAGNSSYSCAQPRDGGPATDAGLCNPQAAAFDATGNLFIADTGFHRVRRVDRLTGVISTVAGNSSYSCSQVRDGGPATDAGLCNPVGLAFDAQGALLIADQSFHRIRRVVPGADGTVTGGADAASETIATVVGNGSCTFAGDGGAATASPLCNPTGVALDAGGALYIADQSNHRIRRVAPGADAVVTAGADAPNETISTVAGTGTAGAAGDGGAATAAQLSSPWGVAFDASGALLVADRNNHRVHRVVPGANAGITGEADEILTTVAGTGSCSWSGDGQAATLAGLCNPSQAIVAPGGSGEILIADQSFHRIRRVVPGPDGAVTGGADASNETIGTLVGSGQAGFAGDGGPAGGVRVTATVPAGGFNSAEAQVQVNATNLALSGLETFRNGLSPQDGFTVYLETPGVGNLRSATPLTIDLSTSDTAVEAFVPGNTAATTVAIASNANNSSTATLAVTGAGRTTIGAQVAAATPPLGPIAGTSAEVTVVPATLGVNSDPLSPSGDNRMTTGTGVRNGQYRVTISGPAPAGGVTAHLVSSDPAKVLLAPYNTTTAGAASLDVTIAAGSRSSAGFDVIGISAQGVVQMRSPAALAVDPADGTMYIADRDNHRIRRVDGATGILTTVAGNSSYSCAQPRDGSAATDAGLCSPDGLALDAAGNLFIADTSFFLVRRVDRLTGVITTVAGNQSYGCSQVRDGGPATDAGLCYPYGLAFDAQGALLIVDQYFYRVRRVLPGADGLVKGGTDAAAETIQTVAGGDQSCSFSGDGGAATAASLCNPTGVAVDAGGALLIADASNSRIRRVAPGSDGVVSAGPDAGNETISTVVGTGSPGPSAEGVPATSASISFPRHLGLDSAGNLLLADSDASRILRVSAGANPGITGEADEMITTLAGSGGGCGFNGDGQAGPLTQLCNPAQALSVPGTDDVLIVDVGFNRVRRIEATTGIVHTALGSGGYGFGGDGGPAAGVRVTASVLAGGFNSDHAEIDVRQSAFRIFPATTTISGLSSTFSAGVEPTGLSCCFRVADTVAIDMTASDPTVLLPATPLSIASNGSSTGNQTLSTVGAGSSALVASTLTSPINSGVSSTITVVPTLSSIEPAAGQAGTAVAATLTGTNLSNAAGIGVSGTGVSVAVTGRSNTALQITLTLDPLAEAGTRTVTVSTPGGDATIGFVVTAGAVTTLRLTDLTQMRADASGGGSSFRFNTSPADSISQAGLTTPARTLPAASPVAFVNPGDRDVSLPLALGTNSFTVVHDTVNTGSPFALNLFFNHATVPGITVYNANGGTGAFSVQAPETAMGGYATGGPSSVPASGVVSFAAADGYTVTLTSYSVTSSSSPFVDLVSPTGIGVPNGQPDTVSSFTLEVAQPGGIQAFAAQGYDPPAGFTALAPGRTTITFDESPFPDGSANAALGAGVRGTAITSQYASLDVSFGTAAANVPAYVFGQFTPRLRGKSLGNNASAFQGTFQSPIGATFTLPQSAVGMVAIDDDGLIGFATLTAYSGPNGTGIALASVSSPGGAGNDPYFLGLVDTGGAPRIRSVIIRFQRVSGSDLVIDDFTFVSSGP